MRYVITDKAKSVRYGISSAGHRTKDRRILLNEKEVAAFVDGDTFERKVSAVDGVSYSAVEVKRVLREEGWK